MELINRREVLGVLAAGTIPVLPGSEEKKIKREEKLYVYLINNDVPVLALDPIEAINKYIKRINNKFSEFRKENKDNPKKNYKEKESNCVFSLRRLELEAII